MMDALASLASWVSLGLVPLLLVLLLGLCLLSISLDQVVLTAVGDCSLFFSIFFWGHCPPFIQEKR